MKQEVIPMAVQTPLCVSQPAWRVVRCFEGDRDPEALLRALIQAHKF